MIAKIKTIFVTTLTGLTLLITPLLVGATVSAQADVNTCLKQGVSLDGSINGTCNDSNFNGSNSTSLTDIIATVVNVISIVVGVIAVIMIIWGGLKYITSGGESSKITGAKNTIIYALIGLVIVALAQFIVRFVLTKASSLNSN